MKPKTPQLVIALDLPSLEQNLQIARVVGEKMRAETHISHSSNIWLKVGLRAFIRDGKLGLEQIRRESGARIFLDLKLYDIPNTMADAAQECAALGVDMITLHASAGAHGMRAVMERLDRHNQHMLVMAVSALTSFDDESFARVYGCGVDSGVRALSNLAADSGVSGIVCSPLESSTIKSAHPNLLTLTPGIRPAPESSPQDSGDFGVSAKPDDQKRIATITQAVQAQADFLVIGRPIYHSHNPAAAIESALAQINHASKRLAKNENPL